MQLFDTTYTPHKPRINYEARLTRELEALAVVYIPDRTAAQKVVQYCLKSCPNITTTADKRVLSIVVYRMVKHEGEVYEKRFNDTLVKLQASMRVKALFLCGNKEYIAEEIVSGVNLKALQKHYLFSPQQFGTDAQYEKNMYNWLSRCIENEFKDYLRKQDTRRAIDIDECSEVSATMDLGCDETEVLQSFPEEIRQMMLLKAGGYNYREIARQMGVLESRVARLMTQAKKQLKQQIYERAR